MHVGHDHCVNLIAAQAERGKRLRQRARLPDRAGRPGIEQDPALTILDQILVEDEAWTPPRPSNNCAALLLSLAQPCREKNAAKAEKKV